SSFDPYTLRAMARYRMSFTKVDFPEPETPVITVSSPRGNDTSMFLRLCARASLIVRNFPFGVRRDSGTGMHNSPEMYWPVSEFGLEAICGGVPEATMCPPLRPAPGPKSNT